MQNVESYYDEVPYFSAAFADCSPLRIEAVGRFLGRKCASARTARVLELGCSYGGNILPFAVHNEHAKVVGIDISRTQVETGNEIAAQIGVKNFRLIQADILALGERELAELGEFDYIIAHGVYSWVNGAVKDALLRCVRALLAPNGIAYVSYNVYPGWKSFDILRDFMVFASQQERSAAGKLAVAKQEIDFLQNYLKFSLQNATDKVYRDSSQLLLTQLGYLKNIMKEDNDYYILHDFLETSNDPTYLYKFVAHAESHGLCYLADCTLDDVFRSSLGIYRFDAHIAKSYKTRVQKEQARDFLLNRSFRKSLLMKREILGGADDFDADIGINEVAGLNFILRSREQKGSAVYEALKAAFPSSLNLAQIVQITTLDISDALSQLIELFAAQKMSVAAYELKAVRYVAGKTRLKARAAAYLSYFANTQKPVMLLADELNLALNFSLDEAQVALKFDGRSTEAVQAELVANGALNAQLIVRSVQEKLEAAFFFEEI